MRLTDELTDRHVSVVVTRPGHTGVTRCYNMKRNTSRRTGKTRSHTDRWGLKCNSNRGRHVWKLDYVIHFGMWGWGPAHKHTCSGQPQRGAALPRSKRALDHSNTETTERKGGCTLVRLQVGCQGVAKNLKLRPGRLSRVEAMRQGG